MLAHNSSLPPEIGWIAPSQNHPHISSDVGAKARRSDIEGLRGLAVACVVLFHGFPQWLAGGFVGVDIFFVISGYLISGIILRALKSGNFGFFEFYSHRVRRIFPALLLVLMACFLTGMTVLPSNELGDLLRQIFAGTVFSSNFLLWHEAGYFDRAAESKILLHLWSLAIEEQFYLIWPLLASFFYLRKRFGIYIFIGFFLSFGLCVFKTPVDQSFAFYSPLTRFWELGAGCILAWAEVFHPDAVGRYSKSSFGGILCIIGLLLIAAASTGFNAQLPFPGALAAIPVMGALLVVGSGPQSQAHRFLLSNALLVGIGRISYPLYLWHWSVLIFSRRLLVDNSNSVVAVFSISLSFLLAWVTYKFVEQPLRLKVPLKRVVYITMLLMLVVCVLSIQGFEYVGAVFDWKGESASQLLVRNFNQKNKKQLTWFDSDADCVKKLKLEEEKKIAGEAIFCSSNASTGSPVVAIIGDSTANHLYPGMVEAFSSRGLSVLNVGNGTCVPFRGVQGVFKWNQVCESVNRKIYAYILSRPEIKVVIFGVASWDIKNVKIPGVTADVDISMRFAAMESLVARDVAALHASGKKIVATFDTPHIGFALRDCLENPSHCTTSAKVVDAVNKPYIDNWRILFETFPEVCIFSQKPAFRTDGGDYAVARDGLVLFRDDHHLSYFGSSEVARLYSKSPCFSW